MLRNPNPYQQRERAKTLGFEEAKLKSESSGRGLILAGVVLGLPVVLMLLGLLMNYLDRVNKDDGPTKEEQIRKQSFDTSPLQRKSVRDDLEKIEKQRKATLDEVE